MKYLVAIPILCILLMACSSGNGGSETATQEQNSNTSSEVTIQSQADDTSADLAGIDSDGDSVTTAQLNIDPDFDFQYSSELNINVSVAKVKSASLKVCRVDGDNKIMINDCMLSTRISDTTYSAKLTLVDDITALAMQVVTIDSTVEIADYYWSRDGGMSWDLEI